jgi:hypothetical protein
MKIVGGFVGTEDLLLERGDRGFLRAAVCEQEVSGSDMLIGVPLEVGNIAGLETGGVGIAADG